MIGPDPDVAHAINEITAREHAERLEAENAALRASLKTAQEKEGQAIDALITARNALAAFVKQVGYLPQQQAYSATMTDGERTAAQAVADLDQIIDVALAQLKTAEQERDAIQRRAESAEADWQAIEKQLTALLAARDRLIEQWRKESKANNAHGTGVYSVEMRAKSKALWECADELSTLGAQL